MKKTALMLLLAAVTAYGASAQKPLDAKDRIQFSVSKTLFSGHLTGDRPGNGYRASADYTYERFAVGVGMDICTDRNEGCAAFLRTGYAVRRDRFALAAYVSGRFRWNDTDPRGYYGLGCWATYRITGPLGLYAEIEGVRPTRHPYTYYARMYGAVGIALSF